MREPRTVLLRDGIVDLRARRVWRAGRVARLSEGETEVLSLLRRHAPHGVERQRILTEALRHHPGALTRAVDLCVHRLRAKLERDPSDPVHLLTVQGAGYRLVPAEAVEEVRTNLAPARTPILGRDALLAEVPAALEAGPVALVGPAGVGKSRLAHEVARAAARTWAPAGAWWVDLAEADGADAVARAVASAAGLEAAPAEALAERLRERGPSLVVLDTCERCVDAAAGMARALDPGTRVLLTSRVAPDGIRALGVDPLADDDAIALLRARAAEAGLGVPLDEAGARRLVDHVDRLPLAIELAAARLSAMPLSRVEQELARPLRLLRARGGRGRLASVEDSVRWSWDALPPADRDALVTLATFRGAVPDEAITALLPAGAVGRLIELHLARTAARGVTLWHAVRELVEAEADRARWAAALADHDRWCAGAAERLAAALDGPGFAAALAALEALDPDLAAAEARAPVGAVALARAELAFERGRYAEVVARVDAILPRLPAGDPHAVALRIRAAAALGRRGDWPGAQARAEAALDEARAARDRVEGLCTVSNALVRRNRFAEGRVAADAAEREAGDDPFLRARAAAAHVLVAFHAWQGEASLEVARRAVRLVEAAGAERHLATARHNVAVALVRANRTDEALVALAAAARAHQNPRSAGITELNLAMLHFGRDLSQALVHAELALERFRDCGAADGERAMLGLCGTCKVLLGDVTDGLADLDEERDRIRDGRGPLVTHSRLARAAVLAHVGRADEARAEIEALRPDVAGHLGLAPADADALLAAWTDGRPVPPDLLARLEAVGGDRRWFHAQLLRWAGRA